MKAFRKNILVPVDFNEASENAIQRGLEIARFIKGNLNLLYVIEAGDLISKIFRNDSELVKLSIEAKSKLDELAAGYRKNSGDVEIHTKVVHGKVHEMVLNQAQEIDARFIILGENHQGSSTENTLGSNVTSIITRSEYPVIISKGEHTSVPNKIVVPLDLTKETRWQVFNAVAFGIHYQAKVYLISVVKGGVHFSRSRIYRKLKRAQQTLIENDVECEVQVYNRSEIESYKKILEYIKEVEADMLLLMTHQEGPKNDNYIGAFAYHIINESEIPVLTLTNKAAEPDLTAVLKKLVDPVGILFGSSSNRSKKKEEKEPTEESQG